MNSVDSIMFTNEFYIKTKFNASLIKIDSLDI